VEGNLLNPSSPDDITRKNVRRFIAFRTFFNARFYYPIFAILFLEFGLTLSQFALLNVVWAVTIVLLEVPSGALADIIGRRRLLVFASAIMVLEIAILCFAPRSNPTLLFVLFLINRIFSGAAEAAASGADEALAYDSLVKAGRQEEWGAVLEAQMRYQAMGWIVAMTLGAAVYDPAVMQRVVGFFGFSWEMSQSVTLRLPLYLTLIMALLTLGATLGMKEIHLGDEEECLDIRVCGKSVTQAFRLTLQAGGWILKAPFALVVILAGMFFDHIIRLILTLDSQYFRLIDLPEATFGIIGSALAVLGMLAPRLARYMADRHSPRFIMLFQTGLTLVGFIGLTLFIPYAGLFPMVFLVGVWYLNSFFVSHYLNQVTPSDKRATVLSFRGLSFNLAYGLIGLLYSWLLAYLRPQVAAGTPGLHETALENAVFIDAMNWFPWYFMGTIVVLVLAAAWLLKGREDHKVVRIEAKQ
jgi:MFS family permease